MQNLIKMIIAFLFSNAKSGRRTQFRQTAATRRSTPSRSANVKEERSILVNWSNGRTSWTTVMVL